MTMFDVKEMDYVVERKGTGFGYRKIGRLDMDVEEWETGCVDILLLYRCPLKSPMR